MKYPSQTKGHDKMDLFSVVLFVLAIAPVTTINLLEDSHSNADDSCEDFRYDGKRLPFAEVIIGDRMFTWKNCGEVVPVDEVNKEIPVVKFSQVRLQLVAFPKVKREAKPERARETCVRPENAGNFQAHSTVLLA